MKKRIENHFELSPILVKDGIATDIGVCTFHDDDKITVETEDEDISVYYRYGDSREDEEFPDGLIFIDLRQFAQEIGNITVVINDKIMDWHCHA
jgi:hypothetical protein